MALPGEMTHVVSLKYQGGNQSKTCFIKVLTFYAQNALKLTSIFNSNFFRGLYSRPSLKGRGEKGREGKRMGGEGRKRGRVGSWLLRGGYHWTLR